MKTYSCKPIKSSAFVNISYAKPIQSRAFVKIRNNNPIRSKTFVKTWNLKPMRSGIFAKLGVSNLYVVRCFSVLADRGLYEVGHLQNFGVIHLNIQGHLPKCLVTKL